MVGSIFLTSTLPTGLAETSLSYPTKKTKTTLFIFAIAEIFFVVFFGSVLTRCASQFVSGCVQTHIKAVWTTKCASFIMQQCVSGPDKHSALLPPPPRCRARSPQKTLLFSQSDARCCSASRTELGAWTTTDRQRQMTWRSMMIQRLFCSEFKETDNVTEILR